MVVIKKKVIRSFSLFFKLPIVNEGEWGKNKIWMKRILVYSANERKNLTIHQCSTIFYWTPSVYDPLIDVLLYLQIYFIKIKDMKSIVSIIFL